MDDNGLPAALIFDLQRGSPFSFKCQVCSACCYNKTIRVSPYEALRLAGSLGLTTTEFYEKYTEEGSVVLRIRADAGCIFLTARGCGVHPDRPLVCRLYPLGQIVDKEGKERFGSMPPHPDCLGLYGSEGTVETYLESQQVAPYFFCDKIYTALYKKMVADLGDREEKVKNQEGWGKKRDGQNAGFSEFLRSTWLDIGASVEAYCSDHRIKSPTVLDKRVAIHIKAIESWLASSGLA